jgi:hypothetical protein
MTNATVGTMMNYRSHNPYRRFNEISADSELPPIVLL